MTRQQTRVRINQIGTVYAPVADQSRAVSFYVDVLEFEKRIDLNYGGGHRWIEVAPAGATHRIALVPKSEGCAPTGVQTLCALETTDVEGMHAALKSRGVSVSDIGRKGTTRTGLFADNVRVTDPVPPQFYLRDPDGNRFLVVQVQ